ncbi:Crp/Fnr family transcriptional regulator [Acidimangrovimonas pyrenivorans]|uniref:Crp/Fnr family transcriptional regulator n=1 Tax=Acidimangrovimonas pyrenivorans TaxID=2030798 RepID=A0ABV7AGV2_9RHOB
MTEIAGFALLAGVPEASLRRFAADLKPLTVAPGQVVIEQGELSREVYFVFSGRLLGLLLSPEGREVAFSDLGPGRYFGEIAALDGQPRSLTISAVTQSRLGRLEAETFRDWMVREPVIGQNLALTLAERNRVLSERIFGLVVHDVDKRVRILLSRLAQARGELRPGGRLKPAPTRDQMATYVGANREAVSRAIARLSAEGIIETGRQSVTFRDIQALLDGL